MNVKEAVAKIMTAEAPAPRVGMPAAMTRVPRAPGLARLNWVCRDCRKGLPDSKITGDIDVTTCEVCGCLDRCSKMRVPDIEGLREALDLKVSLKDGAERLVTDADISGWARIPARVSPIDDQPVYF